MSGKSQARHPRLIVIHEALAPGVIDLTAEAYSIGRADCCEIIVAKSTVSRVHAHLRRHNQRYLREDAHSRNGTYLNGCRIAALTAIGSGDAIGLGSPAPLWEYHDPEATDEPLFRLVFDEVRDAFFLDDEPLSLTLSQLKLLRYLYRRAGQLCTHDDCIAAVWVGDPREVRHRENLHHMISDLRAIFRARGITETIIHTRSKLGYVLDLESFGESAGGVVGERLA